VTAATDLFACGAILFEALVGRPAFAGEKMMEIYDAVFRDQPPALAGGPAIERLDRVIQRALAKRPEERFASAAEMADALRAAWKGGDPVPAVVRAVTRLVAVPFRLLRPAPEIDFLGPALAEAISANLGGLEHLAVRSPRLATGVDPDDLAALAHRAQVDAALVGSLLHAGARVRVTAQLVDLPSGTVRWSGSAEAATDDLFALVDELARQIVDALAVPLSGRERAQIARDVPRDGAAYELYLRATDLGGSTARTSALVEARRLLLECVERDPEFAPAWAQLGRVWRILGKYGHDDPEASERSARQAFERALALNPDSPLAHHLYTGFEVENLASPAQAMLRLLRRVEQRSADAELFAGLVLACRFCGLLGASLAAHDRARRLDPNVATSVHYTWWMLGDYQKAHDLDNEPVAFMRHYAQAMLGRVDEAIAGYEGWLGRIEDGLERQLAISSIGVLRGDPEAALAGARAMVGGGFRDAEGLFFLVRNLARCGLVGEALDQLERVVAGGFTVPSVLRADPWLESLRGEPRFAATLAAAEQAHRHAADLFLRAGGPRLLGLSERDLFDSAAPTLPPV
jgi:TolB-like protein